jgi:prevent-host-death family protein
MDVPVSAAKANRKFSQLLRGVRAGRTYVVMVRGKPVAKLVPVGKQNELASSARAALLARLRAEPVAEIGRWRRDDLYEDQR